ncbi:cupin domain-containing protein [uncultured Aquitalea sp.]|uniref:cupin domain-containing protein n=1 Tax=uncultured Aquitalea sp. TaxID=540272 RepID=UPI0025F7BBEA|nr:cupin domain-containing protein [uncultured Aquitalea sp.]
MSTENLLNNYAVLATTAELDYQPVPAEKTIQGPARVGVAELAALGDVAIGVWEMSPSVTTDVEVDECFVVLAGAGTVAFDDGTPSLTLAPGVVGFLKAGTATTWSISQTLRKIYIAKA